MISARSCPDCGRPIRLLDGQRSGRLCPECGTRLAGEEEGRWVNVARVTNLAEAGFLADELAGEEIEVRIFQSEEFSALSDRWSVHFLIQAPPRDAAAAAAQIRGYLAEMESRYDASGELAADEDWPAFDPAFWRPVALMVLAGVASFALGQKLAERRDPPRAPRNSLARAVSSIGRPLVTEPAAGLPRHRLYYHRWNKAWYLDTDTDGDGRFESHQRFQTAGAGW